MRVGRKELLIGTGVCLLATVAGGPHFDRCLQTLKAMDDKFASFLPLSIRRVRWLVLPGAAYYFLKEDPNYFLKNYPNVKFNNAFNQAIDNRDWGAAVNLLEQAHKSKSVVWSVNAPDMEGRTFLIRAADLGDTEFVDMLLKQKSININAADTKGRTALMWAADCGHTEIVDMLLKLDGIKVNAADTDGRTALLWAEDCGHKKIVNLLQKA